MRRAGKRRSNPLLAALFTAMLALACGTAQAAGSGARPPEVVRIWPAAAPGTESWTGAEAELDAELPDAGKVHIVTNVTVPTLRIFRPRPGRANGTAMLVVPGGAFRALAWDLEGTEVAQWMADRGITAFVLKYRVRPPGASGAPGAETLDAFMRRTGDARRIAAADARQALRLVRSRAAAYGIKADRVGMIGFSAGAMTLMDVVLGADPAARPDFVVSVYGAMAGDEAPAAGAPPLFIVAAQDDPQVPSQKSVEIYERWNRAGLPAELHLYEKGGHGFGMRARGLPADRWPAALGAWLLSRHLATAAGAAAR
ncbi:MAG TPA: dienelactone hydrolase family protein [Allosphingosinicella sp.]|jgi:acetyl esterase/lipase|nr:dienelactone hydrolase family protein [Allosphingosinicella sp.]